MKKLINILTVICILLAAATTIQAQTSSGNTIVLSDGVTASTSPDWQLNNISNVFEIYSGNVTVTGSTTTRTVMVVSTGTVNITLNNATIDASGTGGCAFDVSGAVVYLTLSGTNTLKSGAGYSGMYVPSSPSSTLYINGGASDNLTVSGGYGSAGIGGGGGTLTLNARAGTITINGGTINATGGDYAAGIGGGNDGRSGRITINGGNVTAAGAPDAAGIGGGDGGDCEYITINNGTVYAVVDDSYGAGIGGGRNSDGGIITINGGTVTGENRKEGDSGSGIGPGYFGNPGDVIITGGTVNAIACGLSASIFGDIVISSGTLHATQYNGGSGNGSCISGMLYVSGGEVFATNTSSTGIEAVIHMTGGMITAISNSDFGGAIRGVFTTFPASYNYWTNALSAAQPTTFTSVPPGPVFPIFHDNYYYVRIRTNMPSATSLTSSLNPAPSGQAVTFTATVTPQGASPTTPSGTVQFYIDGVPDGAPVALNASATATKTISTLAIGTYSITAEYSGNDDYTSSVSGVLTQVITKGNTTVLISDISPSTSIVYPQNITFTAQVSAVNPGSVNPVGIVEFFLDGSTVALGAGVLNAARTASLTTTTPIGIGAHTISARYIGDVNYNASAISAAVPFAVYGGLLPTPSFVILDDIHKTYGDPSFDLPDIVDDLGYSTVQSYRSGNPAVATVNAQTGRVTIVSAGEALMYVKRIATQNLGDSPEGVPVRVIVAPKPLTITGITAIKEYDGTDIFTAAQINTSGAVLNGVVGNDQVTFSTNGVTGSYGPNVGTGAASFSGFTLGGNGAPNYTLSIATGTATITAKAITVTANGGSSNYGDSPANPGLSSAGLANGEPGSVLTGLYNSFGINASTPPGVYTLTVEGALTNGNYTLTATATGVWTVNKRPITITAVSKTIGEGETPELEYEITSGSLVNGDVLTGALYCARPYTIGTHDITQGTLSAPAQYEVTFVPGILTVASMDVSINDVVVDGKNAARIGNSFSILAECGANSVDVVITSDALNATASINGIQQNQHSVDLPKYGDNIIQIVITAQYGNTETYLLTVHRSVPVDVAFYNRFADVLTVPATIAGIDGTVSSVEWYHNGVRLDRDPAKGYLEMTGAGAYHALLNGSVRTCEVARSGTRSAMTMSVYPNPANANQEVTISIDSAADRLAGARLQMHSLDGRLLKTVPVSSARFKVTIPDYSGAIVVKLIYKDGNEEVKLIVK